MSDVIRFLEVWAHNPAVAAGSLDAYAGEVAGLDVTLPQKQALLARDASALGRLLNARAELICMVSTPDEQPLRGPDEDGKDPDAEEVPDKDD
ncbi:MAG TPA: hypothetical protein VM619_13975 [Luteimonas sp.]|nr:hypothetical protein [Luteimonas sp.]